MLCSQEDWVNGYTLPVNNACNLGWVLSVDEDVVCVEIIVPEDTG